MRLRGAWLRGRGSVSGRLCYGIAGTLIVASAMTFSGLYLVGRAERVDAFNAALADDLRTIANITVVYPDGDLFVNIEPESLDVYLEGGKRFFQVWDARDGELVDRSRSLEQLGHTFEPPPSAVSGPQRYEARLPDGQVVSLLAASASANRAIDAEKWQARGGSRPPERPVTLLVGRLRAELDNSLVPLAWTCFGGALVLPFLVALALWRLVPSALAPLRSLADAVSARAGDDARPFDRTGTAEIDPIVQRLNELMARISDARRREREFIAHAAHELRTPLAETLVLADVASMDPEALATQREAVIDMRAVAVRMSRLVDALFRLARHQRDHLPVESETLQLAGMVSAALAGQRANSDDRGLRWSVVASGQPSVPSDPVLLRALLDNLIANAISHATEDSQVRVEIATAEGTRFRMANTYVEEARSAGEHLGHGLLVARLYAQALGIALSLRREKNMFEVELAWPPT